MLIIRWLLIFVLSLVIMFPPIWAITTWGVERTEAEERAKRRKPLPGQKHLDFGLRGLDALVVYTAGSFIVIWPLSVWASYRLLRNIGRRREREAAKPAATEAAPELIVVREQVLGEIPLPIAVSPPPVSLAKLRESSDDRPVVAGPEVSLHHTGSDLLGKTS